MFILSSSLHLNPDREVDHCYITAYKIKFYQRPSKFLWIAWLNAHFEWLRLSAKYYNMFRFMTCLWIWRSKNSRAKCHKYIVTGSCNCCWVAASRRYCCQLRLHEFVFAGMSDSETAYYMGNLPVRVTFQNLAP